MGCAASKLDNEDAVRRCKERCRLMKEAVYARHHLAAAHADYCRSLRLMGSALSSFASGEPLSVSDGTPAVLLPTTNPSPSPPPPLYSASSNPIPPRVVPPSPAPSSIHQPPPPPPPFSPTPSPTVASSRLPHILSASSMDSAVNHRRRRKPPRAKLPHILSETSPSSSPKSNFSDNYQFSTAYQANSTFSSTPSQASSVWNWENFYPPSPPDSEFYERKAHTQAQSPNQTTHRYTNDHHVYNPDADDDYDEGGDATETERSEYDFFQSRTANQNHNRYNKKRNYSSVGEETEREEVQCSEWGDHYSSTTTSSDEEDDRESRSEIVTRSNFGSESVKRKPQPQQQPPPMYGKSSAASKLDKSESSRSYRTGDISDMKMVVRHKDLKEMMDAIKENFRKAAAAGDQVSEMLEIGRAQLDRSFSQLKS